MFRTFCLSFFNTIGFLKIQTDKDEDGVSFLEQAEDIYKSNEETIEFNGNELISEALRIFFPLSLLDDVYLKTEFYLAQAYAKQGDKHKAAFYCGSTLQKQIKKLNKNETPEEWDINDFGNNCIGLSQYYMIEHKYLES